MSTLRELILEIESVKRLLLQEANGVVPLGSVAEAVDAALGQGIFKKWLVAFQARDHARCE